MKFSRLFSLSLGLGILLFGGTSQAQEQTPLNFSLTGGATMSRITKDAFENAYGFSIGGFTRYYFLPFVGAGLGLEYEARKLGTKDVVSNLEDGTANFLDIPLLLSFRFGEAAHRSTFDIGGLYAISLSDRVGEGSGIAAAYIEPTNSFGMNLRAGYDYFFPSNFGLGVEGSMKYLPAGAMPLGIGNTVDDNDQHFISLGLNLRLSYGLVL